MIGSQPLAGKRLSFLMRQSHVATTALIFALVCGILPRVVVSEADDLMLVLLSFVVIVVTGVFTYWARVPGTFDVFEPITLAYMTFLLFFPLRLIYMVGPEREFYSFTDSVLIEALIASAVGYLAFCIGYWMHLGRRFSGLSRLFAGEWDFHRLNTVSFVFLLVSVVGLAATWFLSGGLNYFLLLDADVKNPLQMKPWFFYVLWSLLFVQIAALLNLGAWLQYGRQKWITIVYCAAGLVVGAFLPRIYTTAYVLGGVMMVHYLRRRVTYTGILFLGGCLVVYLAAAGFYREIVSPVEMEEGNGPLELVDRFVVRNFDHLFRMTELLTRVPDELPFQWGSTFLPIFFKPIPRSIMPSKPLGASGLMTSSLYPKDYEAGLAPAASAWGEWYINFWWIGIVVGMGLMGALASGTYWMLHRTSGPAAVFMYVFSALAIIVWLRTDFNGAATYYLYSSLPGMVALKLIARR